MKSIQERVAAGAALLDQKKPGWDGRSNLDILDISDGDFCVCAQACDAEFCDAVEDLAIPDSEDCCGSEFGFNASSIDGTEDQEYDELDVEWRNIIHARRKTDASREFEPA